MDGYKAYKYYLAVKLHFTSEKFSVFENGGRVRGSRDTFYKRNDRYIFEKLANKYNEDRVIIQYFVSNFAYNNDNAIYSAGEAEECFLKWKKRKQSMTKMFIDDLTNIINFCDFNKHDYANVFHSVDGSLPVVLNLFLADRISIESLSIMNDLYPDFISDWNNDPMIQIVLGNKMLRIKKLNGFVKYDKEKVTKIFDSFKEALDG